MAYSIPGGEHPVPITSGKPKIGARKRAGKKTRTASSHGARGHLQSASFNAPGQAKKRAGMTSAKSFAPGQTRKANLGSRGKTPTAPTSTPPHPRKANSMTGSTSGGTVRTSGGSAARAQAIAGMGSKIKGNAAPRSGLIASARARRAR